MVFLDILLLADNIPPGADLLGRKQAKCWGLCVQILLSCSVVKVWGPKMLLLGEKKDLQGQWVEVRKWSRAAREGDGWGEH